MEIASLPSRLIKAVHKNTDEPAGNVMPPTTTVSVSTRGATGADGSKRTIGQQFERSANVVGVDMGDDEQVKDPVTSRKRLDALLQESVGRRGSPIDEDPVN